MPKVIHSKCLYVVALPQGISGFQRPSIAGIVTGARKRRDLLEDWTGKLNVSTALFRMNDGHLSDFQPVGGIAKVTDFLAANPWAEATVASH